MNPEFKPVEDSWPKKPLIAKWQLGLLAAGELGNAFLGHHLIFAILIFAAVVLSPLVVSREKREFLSLPLGKPKTSLA